MLEKKKKIILKRRGGVSDSLALLKKKKEKIDSANDQNPSKSNVKSISNRPATRFEIPSKENKNRTSERQNPRPLNQNRDKKKYPYSTEKDKTTAPNSYKEDKQNVVKKRVRKSGKKGNEGNLREDLINTENSKKFFLRHRKDVNLKQTSFSMRVTPREIKITDSYIQVSTLAQKLNIRSSELIGKLMKMGVMTTINHSIDTEMATLLAADYDCKVEVISLYQETLVKKRDDLEEKLESRPPIVTIMGHVDHGKTQLLDSIREANVISSEKGGITQHIGAYQVDVKKDASITFLDTPGHEAFTAMRARGANLTDIVILVVAADDGVMPQTEEAISHAKDAKVPIIVAINKIDKAGANIDKIKRELSVFKLVSEDWGGTTPFVEVSALKKTNLDTLLEVIIATAELLELKSNILGNATGTIVESRLDVGKGAVATVLVQQGILKVGDNFVVGREGGRVRAMKNHKKEDLKHAYPSTPVEIIGLSGIPSSGDILNVLDAEKEVKVLLDKRQELSRREQAHKRVKIDLDNLNHMIVRDRLLELKLIIKADVKGSVEAIDYSLSKLSTDEININIIYSGAGGVSDSDVMLASAAGAIIVCFNCRANASVRKMAATEGVEIRYYTIIYQIIDDVKESLSGMLTPDIHEKVLGELEIREVFKVSSIGSIAGCFVTSGVIQKQNQIRLMRNNAIVYEGVLSTLKRFKDDVTQVKEGFECGVHIRGYNDVKVGDLIESYQKVETKRDIDDLLEKKEKKETEPASV